MRKGIIMMNRFVLDISGHNGKIDFEKLKACGIYGVMIKCTEGQGYLAPKFRELYEGAIAAGLKVGAYHFLKAAKTIAACKEGRWFGQNIEGLTLELGAAVDIEDKGWLADEDGDPITATAAYNVVNAFAQNVAKYGREELYEQKKLFLYANKSFFENYLTDPDLEEYRWWFANPDKLPLGKAVRMVQYSWCGQVEGVEKAVDLNILYEKDTAVKPEALKQLPHCFTLGSREEAPTPAEKALYRITGTIGEQAVDLIVEKE